MTSKVFRRGIHLIAMIALVGVLPSAYATTLREVVQHTVCTNPEVLIRTKVKRASNENVKMAYSRYMPVVDFNFGVGREKADNSNTNFEPRTLWRRNLGVILRENIFEGFTTWYEVCRTKAKTDADSYQVQGTAQDQALFAVETYLNILRTKELIAVAEDNLQTHQRIYNMIKQRSESGVGREADISQVTGRLALAESNLYAAQNNLKNARTNFYRVTGLTSDHLAMPVEPPDSCIPRTVELAMYKALKNNPKMHVAVTDVEEARAQHNVSHATAFPVVDVVLAAQNDHNVNGTEGHDNHYLAALELHYNLFRGGNDIARQRETAYFTQEAAEIRNRTCRETKENVNLAWNNLQTARKRLPTLYTHKVSSVKTAQAYHDQFRLGKRTLLDLLDSENERFRSSEEYIDGKYEILINKFRTIQGMGELTSYLHVTTPEEGTAEYGLYHPEANPVVVKRHIEARIPARDYPSALYHADEPPHVHHHEHHPHHGHHQYRRIATNPRHTQVVSNNPRHYQNVATNPRHTQRVSNDPSHFSPPTDSRYTRRSANQQNTQPQQVALNQDNRLTRAHVAPRRMVHFGNRHQQQNYLQRQNRNNTTTQSYAHSSQQRAAQKQESIIPKQTIEAYQHDKPQLDEAQQREANASKNASKQESANSEREITKTTSFNAQSEVNQQRGSEQHLSKPQLSQKTNAESPKHYAQLSHQKGADNRKSSTHMPIASQQAHHWQQQPSFDTKSASNLAPRHPQSRNDHFSAFQQHRAKHYSDNQLAPLKEGEGLTTQIPNRLVQQQNSHHQPAQHNKTSRFSYDADHNHAAQPSYENYKPQYSARNEPKSPHTDKITSASDTSLVKAPLQRQAQPKLQAQTKPKQRIAHHKHHSKPSHIAANTQQQSASKAEPSSNLQAKFNQELQQLREAQTKFSKQQTQLLQEQAKAQKEWQQQQAKAQQQLQQQLAKAKQLPQPQAQPTREVVKTGPDITGWAVQLGTFKDQGEVNKLVIKLRKSGMNGFMREIQSGKGTIYEVFVGPTKQRVEADNLARKLKSIQLGGSVVRADI